MDSRKRFIDTVGSGHPDGAFLWQQWTFKDTRDRWNSEGMPVDVQFNGFFGFDRVQAIPLNFGLCPPFEEDVVEETGEQELVRETCA